MHATHFDTELASATNVAVDRWGTQPFISNAERITSK